MRTTLVIMAAGLGSRFGGGIKQLAPVGLNGEIIMDYSIHDAIEAGFNKIVFIIRKDIKDAFKEAIGDRIEKICNNLDVESAYAYQELSELPEGVDEWIPESLHEAPPTRGILSLYNGGDRRRWYWRCANRIATPRYRLSHPSLTPVIAPGARRLLPAI